MKLKLQHILLSLMIASFFIGFAYPDIANATSKQDKSAKRTALMIQKIKQDVTRHRYGDDAHLDTTLDALGNLVNQCIDSLLCSKSALIWGRRAILVANRHLFGPD